jgi:hypothetical protein
MLRVGSERIDRVSFIVGPTIILPPQFNSTDEATVPLASIPSIRFGAGFLARTFARFVKDLVDISTTLSDAQQHSQVCGGLTLFVLQYS